MYRSMDCPGVLDEKMNYIINGLKGEKEKFLFSLRKYIIDFMMKISFDL